MVAQKAWKLETICGMGNYLWNEFELIEANTTSIWDDESWETNIIIAKHNFTSRKTDSPGPEEKKAKVKNDWKECKLA